MALCRGPETLGAGKENGIILDKAVFSIVARLVVAATDPEAQQAEHDREGARCTDTLVK